MHADVNAGMIFSNLVAFFIIVTTAATLGAHGKHDIATAQQAAEALRPLAGQFAELLFALGMVGTGMLAVPVLAGSSAYVAAQTFKFREGLNEPPARAPRFYGVIVAGIVVGIAMNLLHDRRDQGAFWSAVLNGVAAVPIIAVIVWLASNSAAHGALEEFADRSRLGLGDRCLDGRGDPRHVLLPGQRIVRTTEREPIG